MAISRERILSRLDELKLQREQHRLDHLAVSGAIANLEFLLAEDAPPAPSDPPPSTKD